ncbi:MAG TPA: TIM barrel protein [Clostridiales bacterium]|jgi:sugar phosphate isomerase/epimerase|nr:TIM barrel protein [Clostridiales bacterium]
MKITTNITNTYFDVDRFTGEDDVRDFCRRHRLDGFELLPYEVNTLGVVPDDMVVGVHLSYYNCWVDFWTGNLVEILEEYGDLESVNQILGADRSAFVQKYRSQLDFAESIGAEYVVFHVSEVSMREALSYSFKHSDAQVIDASVELINEMLDCGNYSFMFLVENLWWPGFTMTSPDITRRLLEGIHYNNKGIMLDTGHLMHTNNDLSTQEEAVKYIHAALDAHGELCRYIKGVHLQQSLTGEYVRRLIKSPAPLFEGTYYERMGQMYPYINGMDTHLPFTAKGVRGLVERISPDYLTYEFITRGREEQEEFISRQNAALWGE